MRKLWLSLIPFFVALVSFLFPIVAYADGVPLTVTGFTTAGSTSVVDGTSYLANGLFTISVNPYAGGSDAPYVISFPADFMSNPTAYNVTLLTANGANSLGSVSDVPLPSPIDGVYQLDVTSTTSLSVGEINLSFSGATGDVTFASMPTVTDVTAVTSPPTDVQVNSVTNNSAVVSWTAYSGASSYTVKNSSGVVLSSGITGTSYSLTGLSADTAYGVTVAAVNSYGAGPYSSIVGFTTLGPPMTAPTGLHDSSVTGTSATITWSPFSGATSYSLLNAYNDTVIASGLTGTSFNWSGLSIGTGYQVEVAASNAFGLGPYSSSFTVDTLGPPSSSPVGLSVSNVTGTGATLSWSALSGATGYTLKNAQSGVVIASGISATSYNWTGLSMATGYEVEVAASNAQGLGPFSPSLAVTTLGPPTIVVSGLSVSGITSDGFTVSWSSLAGITSYDVYVDGSLVDGYVNATSEMLSGYKSSSSHTVTVAPVNVQGVGPQSSAVPVVIGVVPVPTGLVAAVGDSTVSLTWQPDSDAVSYIVLQNGTAVGAVRGGTTVAFNNLQNGSSYDYQVEAVDVEGNDSLPTAVVSAIPHPPPVSINGLSALSGGTVLHLQWGGTEAPYTVVVKDSSGKVVSSQTLSTNTLAVTGLTVQTQYTVTVTDSGANSVNGSYNSGAESLLAPNMPDATATYHSFGGIFGDAGKIFMFIIGGALLLGALMVVSKFGWRKTKQSAAGNGAGSAVKVSSSTPSDSSSTSVGSTSGSSNKFSSGSGEKPVQKEPDDFVYVPKIGDMRLKRKKDGRLYELKFGKDSKWHFSKWRK